MNPKNKQRFTNSTAGIKKKYKLKNKQLKMTSMEDINLTPASELGINMSVGPSEYSATHV